MNNLINDEIKIVKSKITAPKGFLAGGIHSGIKKYKKDFDIYTLHFLQRHVYFFFFF